MVWGIYKRADKIKAKLIINSQENVGTEVQLGLNKDSLYTNPSD